MSSSARSRRGQHNRFWRSWIARCLIAAVWIGLGSAVAGCAHTRTDWNPATRLLCSGRVCYRVGDLPAGWRMVHAEGAEIGFFNQSIAAVIQGNATCRDDADPAPLGSLTAHLLIGYTDRQTRSTERVAVDGREALHSVIDARLDGVPV